MSLDGQRPSPWHGLHAAGQIVPGALHCPEYWYPTAASNAAFPGISRSTYYNYAKSSPKEPQLQASAGPLGVWASQPVPGLKRPCFLGRVVRWGEGFKATGGGPPAPRAFLSLEGAIVPLAEAVCAGVARKQVLGGHLPFCRSASATRACHLPPFGSGRVWPGAGPEACPSFSQIRAPTLGRGSRKEAEEKEAGRKVTAAVAPPAGPG